MRPYHDKTPAERLTVNVVDVFEPQPPLDEEPIAWTLLTSQPIDTVEQQIAIVDIYRARWLIEEFFKAVKTGCDYEAKQLESKETLLPGNCWPCALCPVFLMTLPPALS